MLMLFVHCLVHELLQMLLGRNERLTQKQER